MRLSKEGVCLLTIGVIALTLFVGSRNSGIETRHATGTIVETGEDITIRTDDGHEWLTGHCGYGRGTRVSVDFDTRGTSEIEDDIIVNIKPIKIGNGLRKNTVVDYRYAGRR